MKKAKKEQGRKNIINIKTSFHCESLMWPKNTTPTQNCDFTEKYIPRGNSVKNRDKKKAYLVAFDTTSGEFLLIAIGTVDFLFSGDKALGSNGGFTHYTGETFLVPLSGFVFHFLGSWEQKKRTIINKSSGCKKMKCGRLK